MQANAINLKWLKKIFLDSC